MSDFYFMLIACAILIPFAVTHSLFASLRAKQWFQTKFGKAAPVYRLLYNLLSIAFVAGYFLVLSPGDEVLYRIPMPWMAAAIALQVLGGFLVLRVLFIEFDGADFIGLRQLIGGREVETGGFLRTGGLFGLCRHPLYLGTLMAFTFSPVMTRSLAVFTVFIAVYAWIGSRFEERRLVDLFGEPYREYQRRTKRIIPFLF